MYFQELFTELKNLFSLLRYDTDQQSCMVLAIIGKCIGKYIGNICKKYNFFNLPKIPPARLFKLETPNLDQLLILGLQKITLRPIFDICLIFPDLGPFVPLLRNNWQKLCNNYQNLGNRGKYQKSRSERFFVILR